MIHFLLKWSLKKHHALGVLPDKLVLIFMLKSLLIEKNSFRLDASWFDCKQCSIHSLKIFASVQSCFKIFEFFGDFKFICYYLMPFIHFLLCTSIFLHEFFSILLPFDCIIIFDSVNTISWKKISSDKFCAKSGSQRFYSDCWLVVKCKNVYNSYAILFAAKIFWTSFGAGHVTWNKINTTLVDLISETTRI